MLDSADMEKRGGGSYIFNHQWQKTPKFVLSELASFEMSSG